MIKDIKCKKGYVWMWHHYLGDQREPNVVNIHDFDYDEKMNILTLYLSSINNQNQIIIYNPVSIINDENYFLIKRADKICVRIDLGWKNGIYYKEYNENSKKTFSFKEKIRELRFNNNSEFAFKLSKGYGLTDDKTLEL